MSAQRKARLIPIAKLMNLGAWMDGARRRVEERRRGATLGELAMEPDARGVFVAAKPRSALDDVKEIMREAEQQARQKP